MRKHFTSYLLGVGVVLLTAGCEKDSDADPVLLNTRWKLDRIGDFSLGLSSYHFDYDSYIQFSADKSVKGLATCTDFSGDFTYAPAKNELSLGALTLAPPTCNSPYIAARYLAALPTIVRYEVDATTLRLYDAQNKDPQLVFKAAP